MSTRGPDVVRSAATSSTDTIPPDYKLASRKRIEFSGSSVNVAYVFSNDQRRRLAAKAKALGREGLNEISDLVSPDTLLRWYRKLIAKKYDGTQRRGPGRPRLVLAEQDWVRFVK